MEQAEEIPTDDDQLGLEPRKALKKWIKMNRWQSVMRPEVRFVMTLDWFRRLGLVFLQDQISAFSRTGKSG